MLVEQSALLKYIKEKRELGVMLVVFSFICILFLVLVGT